MEIQIFKHNDIEVVSSRTVAKGLGKEHAHVIRDIKKILEDNPNLDSRLFLESKYKNTQNKEQPEYLLNQDGFTLLVFTYQGYVDFKLTYIAEFNRMKDLLNNIYKGGVNALESAKKLVEIETKEITKRNEQLTNVLDCYQKYGNSVLTRDFVKIVKTESKIDIGDHSFRKILREKFWCKNDLPKSQYMKYFEVVTTVVDTKNGIKYNKVVMISPKGILYFTNYLLKMGDE